jgi:rubredoxin
MDTIFLCTNCDYWYDEDEGYEVVKQDATMTDPEVREYITPCCSQSENKVTKQFNTERELLEYLNRGEK